MKNYGVKLGNFFRSITNNAVNYNEKYINIKFDSIGDFPLKKALKVYKMMIVARYKFIK